MSSPWAKIAQPEPTNLQDIISEQVAHVLQEKETKKFYEELDSRLEATEEAGAGPEPFKEDLGDVVIPDEVLEALSDSTFESDAKIAQMLQMQFDKEYDGILKMTENKVNGDQKVSISFDKYRRAPNNFDFESDLEEEEIEDICDRKDWDRFDALDRDFASFPPCGYKMHHGKIITKHDTEMSMRKNACKMLSFPPGFQTGDGEEFDMKISNKVFNKLRAHSKQESSRRHRTHDKKEDQATAEFGLDERTRLMLYKMINSKLLSQVNGIISKGKEAVIIHAETDSSFFEQEDSRPKLLLKDNVLPEEVVIKVFKTILVEFKQRDIYIKGDYRFKDRMGKNTSRETINLWAEKEMSNLKIMESVGLPCPKVVLLKKHILVMSFIGQSYVPAPKLKDARMSRADYIQAYEEISEAMKVLYNKAQLVHADMSEYNILWHENKCYFIDVGQSVQISHENAFPFLLRDCKNIVKFFERKGVPNLPTAEDLFQSITGCDFNDQIALCALQESFKQKPHLVDKPGMDLYHNFETAWDRSQSVVKEELVLVEPPQA